MENQNNVPKLRFPEFSDIWVVEKFGDVMDIKVTNSFSRDNLNYENGTIKNIHYGDIHTKFQTLFDITKEYVPFINENISINRISEDFYCKEGDVVFADASEDLNDVGKSIEIINLNNEKILSGLHTLLVRPKNNLFALGFNGCIFKSNTIRLQIQKEAQGTKVLSISGGRLSNIILSFPSVPEQQKIAKFLSTVDEKLQALKKKKSLLEIYKKGVMQKLFSQKIRFKDDEGNDFEDWKVKTLGQVAKRKTLKNKEGNLNVLTISAQLGLISQLEYFNKSVSAKDVTGYYLLEKGDFAYNKSYSKGYPMGAIKCLNRYDKGVVSTLYICFTFNNGVNLSFMEHYFETGLQNKEIENVAQEGARNHGLLNIGLEDFFGIELFLPTFPEQTKIASFLTAIDKKINKVDAQINQTELWKKGLSQQMFV